MENSGYSDIYEKSPLKPLRDLPYALALLDQCQVGGELENEKIRKRTHFQSNTEMQHLHITCKGGHKHLHLRGKGRAASSAQYPEGECKRIMQDGLIPPEADGASEGGRISPTSFWNQLLPSFCHQSCDDPWEIPIGTKLHQMRKLALEGICKEF